VWRSFFELLKLKKQERLPPFARKISPPGIGRTGLWGGGC